MLEQNIPFEWENKVCEKWLFDRRCRDCIFEVLCNLEHEEERYRKKREEKKEDS